MPGVSVRIDYNSALGLNDVQLKNISGLLNVDRGFTDKILFRNSNCFVLSNTYDEYPLSEYDFPGFKVILEGKIYNDNRIRSSLKELCDSLSDEVNEVRIRNWIKEKDGDYIISIFIESKNEYVLINDSLGRLPLYTFNDNQKVLISRDLKFIINQLPSWDIEKFGVAETMLFGYPLGRRTFIKNILRVPPSTLIHIIPDKSLFNLAPLHTYNFDNKDSAGKTIDTITDEVIDLFLDGTKNRISERSPNILSLSGGLDSRSLLGGFLRLGAEFNAETYIGYNEHSEKDAAIAKELSQKLNFDLKFIQISNPLGNELFSLLKYKNGMNTLGSTFLTIFYKKLQEKYGRGAFYFTGDGGDKVFPDHRPSLPVQDTKSLLDYTISNKYFFSLKQISNILSLDKKTFLEHLIDHFESYPERTPDNKFVHFIMAERGIKWLFEAEDRNRNFLWTVAPMYSVQLFDYLMDLPDDMKSKHLLYNSFLNKLIPGNNEFKNALWGVALDPDNYKYKVHLFAKNWLYPRLPAGVKRLIRMRFNKTDKINLMDSGVIGSILEVVLNKSQVGDIFNKDKILNIASMSKAELYIIFTLIMSVEFYNDGSSTLENFLDEKFI